MLHGVSRNMQFILQGVLVTLNPHKHYIYMSLGMSYSGERSWIITFQYHYCVFTEIQIPIYSRRTTLVDPVVCPAYWHVAIFCCCSHVVSLLLALCDSLWPRAGETGGRGHFSRIRSKTIGEWQNLRIIQLGSAEAQEWVRSEKKIALFWWLLINY